MYDVPLLDDVLASISLGIGMIAGTILVWGVVVGAIELIRLEFGRIRDERIRPTRERIRQDVGFYILLSLEFLIAADIMRTILHPRLQELGILGGIVAIRTVISIFLNREIQEAVGGGEGSE